MTPTNTPVTLHGQFFNLQIVLGGRPTINNYTQPPATQPLASSRSARPTPRSSRSGTPPTSSSRRAPSTARGRSNFAASQEHHVQAAASVPFPSPHPEAWSSTASLLSALGSPMESLDGLQASTYVATGLQQFNAAEGRIHQYPSPVMYMGSHAGDLRFREHERVDNNLSHRNDCTANMYRSSEHIPFPMPCLPPCSFPTPSLDFNVWSVPGPDRFDWFIDEMENEDNSDDGDEGYR